MNLLGSSMPQKGIQEFWIKIVRTHSIILDKIWISIISTAFYIFVLNFQIAMEKNYGKSLFSRFQRIFLGKTGSPIFRINIQHRMHPEILKWPNLYFYNNRLRAVASKTADNFPIVPFKIISYSPIDMESDNIMMIIDILSGHNVDKSCSIGIICASPQQKLNMQSKLM